MGIRINFQLIVGLTDAKTNDVRFKGSKYLDPEDLYETEIPPFSEYNPFKLGIDLEPIFKDKRLCDIWYFGGDWGPDGVLGYIIDRGDRGSDLMYALAMYLDTEDAGYAILPIQSRDEIHFRDRALLIPRSNESKYRKVERRNIIKALRENRTIPYYQYYMTEFWYDMAMHVFWVCGWIGVTRRMLKPILVWDWR